MRRLARSRLLPPLEDEAHLPPPDDEAPLPPPGEATEKLWPSVGDRVAVGVEHLGHTLRMGEQGTSEGSHAMFPNETLVKFDSANMISTVRAPYSDPRASRRDNENT